MFQTSINIQFVEGYMREYRFTEKEVLEKKSIEAFNRESDYINSLEDTSTGY